MNDEINELVANPDAAARAHGYRLLNRRFHGVIHEMAHSPVVAELSHRMWDMSDLLINTSGVPQPLASAVSDRHDDHQDIISALRDRDQAAARTAMEKPHRRHRRDHQHRGPGVRLTGAGRLPGRVPDWFSAPHPAAFPLPLKFVSGRLGIPHDASAGPSRGWRGRPHRPVGAGAYPAESAG